MGFTEGCGKPLESLEFGRKDSCEGTRGSLKGWWAQWVSALGS